MARPNKIWFRKDTGWWMVTLDGNKIRLAQGRGNRKLAEQKFHEMKAVRPRAADDVNARVADIVDSFLSWSKIHRSFETCRNLVWYGQKFAEHVGYLPARELRPTHVTQWVDAHSSWGQTTHRNARRSVYRAFQWAVEEGLLPNNPLKGMRCPAALTRQRAMSDHEFRAILKASKRDYKILIFSLRMTGCHPKEARSLTWDQVRDDRWILPNHKTAYRTGKPRVVYLTASMRRLMGVLRREVTNDASSGEHVFLNSRRRPWTMNAVRLRMDRIKRKLNLPSDLCPYHLRHAFGTAAVLNGVDVLSVAELMGHTNLEMVQRVYVHLADEHRHLALAAERATRRPVVSKPLSDGLNQVG